MYYHEDELEVHSRRLIKYYDLLSFIIEYAIRLTFLSFLTGASAFMDWNCFLEIVILTKYVTLTVIADYSSGSPKTIYPEI